MTNYVFCMTYVNELRLQMFTQTVECGCSRIYLYVCFTDFSHMVTEQHF